MKHMWKCKLSEFGWESKKKQLVLLPTCYVMPFSRFCSLLGWEFSCSCDQVTTLSTLFTSMCPPFGPNIRSNQPLGNCTKLTSNCHVMFHILLTSVDIKCSDWSARSKDSKKMVKKVLDFLSEESILERTQNCDAYFQAIETVAEKPGTPDSWGSYLLKLNHYVQ